MKYTLHLIVITAMTFGACERPSPEQQVVNDAAQALGGREAIQGVKTLVIQGEGTNGNLGQDVTPEATSETFKVTDYKRSVDVAAGRARVEQTRTPNFTYFQGQGPAKQVMGIDGTVGYNVGADGTATRVPNGAAGDRRAEIYAHPITIVRAAMDKDAKLANPRTLGSESIVDVTTANGIKFTLATDSTTKLPTRVVTMTDNTNLGDVAIETSFGDYQPVEKLKLPAHLTTKLDNYTMADIRVTKQSVNADVGDLAAPMSAAAAPPITGDPPAIVTVEEVAKGVWWLAGQTHHSVLVEFGDHMTLIEAPQNETRSLAVIAKARAVKPDKPLTQVVNTHHHFDHSGGIRAAVSEGLTVITHKANAQFYKDAVGKAHTIVPDALAKNPKPLKMETVDEEMTLSDKTRTVNLYHIAGNSHADTLLMAYLPKEHLLVDADVYNPGAPLAPFAANFLNNIKKLKLHVDRIVPIHGKIGTYKDLEKMVASTSK